MGSKALRAAIQTASCILYRPMPGTKRSFSIAVQAPSLAERIKGRGDAAYTLLLHVDQTNLQVIMMQGVIMMIMGGMTYLTVT